MHAAVQRCRCASPLLHALTSLPAIFPYLLSPNPYPNLPPPPPSPTTRHIEVSGKPGAVYLVGTGPGDPGLLTLRAVQLMQTADVVMYDRLVSEDILELVHPGALMVYVGKQRGFHTRTQEEIQELLGFFAGEGATVVRLKGGDPFVFGRGGEEVQHLGALGVSVHVVPGITAAAGIAAELGIPLTHRGLATSVRFLTGHSREGGEDQLDDTGACVCVCVCVFGRKGGGHV